MKGPERTNIERRMTMKMTKTYLLVAIALLSTSTTKGTKHPLVELEAWLRELTRIFHMVNAKRPQMCY